MRVKNKIEIRVNVTSDSKRASIVKLSGKSDAENIKFKISVKEKAKRGLANDKVKDMIAKFYGIESVQVRLLSGARSKNKRFEIAN